MDDFILELDKKLPKMAEYWTRVQIEPMFIFGINHKIYFDLWSRIMNMNKATAKLGKIFESTYRLALVGEFLVRKMSRGMTHMTINTSF